MLLSRSINDGCLLALSALPRSELRRRRGRRRSPRGLRPLRAALHPVRDALHRLRHADPVGAARYAALPLPRVPDDADLLLESHRQLVAPASSPAGWRAPRPPPRRDAASPAAETAARRELIPLRGPQAVAGDIGQRAQVCSDQL